MSESSGDTKNKPPEMTDIQSLDTYSLIGLFLGILVEKAWQTMGLRTKPGTDKIETDFDQASVAIDAAGFLAEKLRSHLPDDEKQRLEGLVADLRLNYVRLAKAP